MGEQRSLPVVGSFEILVLFPPSKAVFFRVSEANSAQGKTSLERDGRSRIVVFSNE